MSKFFYSLVSEDLIKEWALVLDWLFDDSKFSKDRHWNGGYTSSYTKKIKRLEHLSNKDKRIKCKCKPEKFPNQAKSHQKGKLPLIMMAEEREFARNLIRHIRNGIAHGETVISRVGETLYIEILDYSNKVRSPDKQTAYLFVPLSYITQFYKIYEETNKSIMNTTEKDRKATKKYKKRNDT